MSIYEHTQRSPLHLILLTLAALFVASAQSVVDAPRANRADVGGVPGGIPLPVFCKFDVRDDNGLLTFSYGPRPLFGSRSPGARSNRPKPDPENVVTFINTPIRKVSEVRQKDTEQAAV